MGPAAAAVEAQSFHLVGTLDLSVSLDADLEVLVFGAHTPAAVVKALLAVQNGRIAAAFEDLGVEFHHHVFSLWLQTVEALADVGILESTQALMVDAAGADGA